MMSNNYNNKIFYTQSLEKEKKPQTFKLTVYPLRNEQYKFLNFLLIADEDLSVLG